MNGAGPSLFAEWRDRRDGFAPLFVEPVMRDALEHLAIFARPGATVLDLGSGAGHVADAFSACGAHAIALDIAPDALGAARALYRGAHPVAADAARLPLASGSVDAVFCFSVLQYTDRESALDEIRRVLRPGGRVAIVENLEGSPLARIYRLWRRMVGIRYPQRLTPLRHVRWSERGLYAQRFPEIRIDARDLISTGLLFVPHVYYAPASEPRGSPARTALGWARRIDTTLMRAAPWLRNGAWILLARG